MKKLLIHNNNTFLNQTDYFNIEEQFVFGFNTDNVEIDKIIQKELTTGTLIGKIMQSDVLFIKISLSKNYLEYLGIRLAYHIRLTLELNDKSTIPIVFVAEEDLQFVGITSEIPSLLFTRGIYFMKDDVDGFNTYKNLIEQKKLNGSVALDLFKKKISLPAPNNYSSHHSIDNELALLTWSEYIGCFDDLPFKKLEFHNSLYYKLYKGNEEFGEHKQTLREILNKGKILLIDDEFDKGWHVFYKSLFKENEGIVFDSVHLDYKKIEKDEIILESSSKIEKFNPDVVILDLRLSEKDFNENIGSDELTGYKILQFIKNYNKGIRVIIITASNKSWNFNALQNIGANDYVTKSIDQNSYDKLNFIKKSLDNNLELSHFLKKSYNRINKLKKILKNQEYHKKNKFKDFYKSSIRNLEVSFEMLENVSKESKYLNYAYLQLFLIIEEYLSNDLFFVEGRKKSHVINNKHIRVLEYVEEDRESYKYYNSSISYKNYKYSIVKEIIKFRKIDVNYKMSAILIYRFGFSDSKVLKWKDILNLRNSKAAHAGGENAIIKNEIIMILDFIAFILDEDNANDKNINKSLDMSMGDKIGLLSKKYPKRHK